ncbi:hypothetical protein BURC_02934 [Burkholderiaceae bacterium]|nr:hypothetical protein BURC_02934 [Burkholderiaceae bacterium]
MNERGGELKDAVRRKGSFLQTMRAVAWSFFGVRKSSEYERDVSELNPVHVIVAGVIAAVLFIVALIVIVNWVLASGVAS